MEFKERLLKFADKFKKTEVVKENQTEVIVPNQVIRVARTRIKRRYVVVGSLLGIGAAVAGYFIHKSKEK